MHQGIYVFEGIDGSGKSTQFELFTDTLEASGLKYKRFKYPQYDDCLTGALVSEYLNNDFGPADELHPKLTSVLYALNRFETVGMITQWLEEGFWVLLDRYTTANMGHQLGKLEHDEDRLAFLAWLEELEYNILGLPRPTKVFWLDMPPAQAVELLGGREAKAYIKDSDVDGHENAAHLEKARAAYAFVASRQKEWERIECVADGKLRSPDDIHKEIIKKTGL